MNLLKLSPEVIETIYALGDPISVHMITERSLRPLLVLSTEQQKAYIDTMLSHTGLGTSTPRRKHGREFFLDR